MKTFPVIRVIVGAGLVVVGLAVGNSRSPRTGGHAIPVARADSGCSTANLSGPYAFSAQGTLLTSVLGLPAPAPWGEVARVDFDGAGSFSAIATVNVGGVTLNSITVTGTYTINPNCTGAFRIPLTAQDAITEAVVVIGGGERFVLTHTESFAVVQGRGERIAD